MEIKGDCPFCANHLENINHHSCNVLLLERSRLHIVGFYPIPFNGDLHFLDWIEVVRKYGNAYNKL